VARPLKQLRETLKIRRYVQRQIERLDELLDEGTITQGHYDSTISDYRSRLKAVNRAVEDIRNSLRSRLSEARRREADASTKLAAFQARREQGKPNEERYAREEDKLRSKLEEASARRAELERAISAESPADLRAHGEAEPADEEEYNPFQKGHSAEFPGISVPERLFALVREARNPEARKAITVSSAVLGVLTAVVIGVVIISAALADDSGTDIIGKGEVLVPVVGENLKGVGEVSFTLDYDEDVLTAIEVVPGVLARARTLTSEIDTGIISVDIASTYGFDAAGELVLIVFSIDDIVTDPSDIILSSASALTRDEGGELDVDTEAGWVDTMTFNVYAPVLRVA